MLEHPPTVTRPGLNGWKKLLLKDIFMHSRVIRGIMGMWCRFYHNASLSGIPAFVVGLTFAYLDYWFARCPKYSEGGSRENIFVI